MLPVRSLSVFRGLPRQRTHTVGRELRRGWSGWRVSQKVAGERFFSRVDERMFLHRVNSDFSETRIYEVETDGSITERITATGYAITRVRVG